MSKLNRARAQTLQETLKQAQLRETILALIIYELLPRDTADATIKEVFEAVAVNAPATIDDLKLVIRKAVDTTDVDFTLEVHQK